MLKLTSHGVPFVGVIDSLSAGFAVAVRRFWLMAIPVLVDLFLWLGVRLSVEPIVRAWLRLVQETPLPNNVAALPEGGQEALLQLAQGSNLFALLKAPAALVQTVSSGFLLPAGSAASLPGLEQAVAPVHSLGLLLVASVVLLVVGLFLSTVYLCGIAQVVRRTEGEPWLPAWSGVRVAWRRISLYALALLLLLVMLAVPLSVLVALAALTGQGAVVFLLNFMLLIFTWLWLWLTVYLFFATNAMALNDMGTWQGIWASVR
ncbi:MAG: hypothetical protein GX605_04005, partial [Chloroflexi bacterium]|nr:hypothetical protein [Chloroflexota bacterium]